MLQPSSLILSILRSWADGQTPTKSAFSDLAAWALADPQMATAFGITPENVTMMIEKRSQLFESVLAALKQDQEDGYIEPFFSFEPTYFLWSLWNLWLPLALGIATAYSEQERPLIQGILGGQGTGKTTLAHILIFILDVMGYNAITFSLDDLYKTYVDRCRLREHDPRLIWRGPPGTHDLDLGVLILDQLRQSEQKYPILIPRFDKSAWNGAGDRTDPEMVMGVDIVLFEGWFVGVRPIDPLLFATAPLPIVTDADRLFARDMNDQLQHYLPLWERLDRLIVLYVNDYRLSIQWRQQAEHELIAVTQAGMSDAEIENFVKYFWKALHPELFIKPLTRNPQLVDLVIEINPDHSVGAVYQPQN